MEAKEFELQGIVLRHKPAEEKINIKFDNEVITIGGTKPTDTVYSMSIRELLEGIAGYKKTATVNNEIKQMLAKTEPDEDAIMDRATDVGLCPGDVDIESPYNCHENADCYDCWKIAINKYWKER